MAKRTKAPPQTFPGDVPASGFRAGTITVVKRAKDPEDKDESEGAEEYDVSLSSEEPVGRWFGEEILDHSAKSIDLSRAAQGLPLLKNHDSYGALPIGRIHDLKAEGGKLRGVMTFAPTADGKDAKALVDFGHREMSVGYSVERYEVTEGRGDAPSTYRATRWTPLEASLVSVPADHTIGVGRNGGRLHEPQVVRGPAVQEPPPAPAPVTVTPPAETTATRGVVTMSETAAPNGREDAAEIMLRAARHGIPTEEAAKWIREGMTLAQASQVILERVTTPPAKQPAAELQLTEKEAQDYSYCRAILAAADERAPNSFEREISRELEGKMPVQFQRRGGLLIPTSLRGIKHPQLRQPMTPVQRAAVEEFMSRTLSGSIDSATSNAIKETVFTIYGGELIEFLRNQARVVECGARVLTGLSSPVAFPRQTSDVPATWVAENPGSDMSRAALATDLVTLSPKTLQAATAFSRQLLVQASVDVEAMVRASIGYAHALAWDLAAIHGSGSSNQPLGIYLSSGVGVEDFTSTPTTGHQLQYPFVVDMENKVATANALRGSLSWLTNPGVAKSAKTKLEFPSVSGSRKIWEGAMLDGEMDGYPARATNQVSKTMTSPGLAATGGSYYGLVFGNWADLLIGQFGGAMELVVDPYTLKLQGMIDVASFQMVDIQVRHGPSFCVAKALDATV